MFQVRHHLNETILKRYVCFCSLVVCELSTYHVIFKATAEVVVDSSKASSASSPLDSVSVELPEEGKEYEENDWLEAELRRRAAERKSALQKLHEQRSASSVAPSTTSAQPSISSRRPATIWDQLHYPDLWNLLRGDVHTSARSSSVGPSSAVKDAAAAIVPNQNDIAPRSSIVVWGESDAQLAVALASSVGPSVSVVSIAKDDATVASQLNTVVGSNQHRVLVANAALESSLIQTLLSSTFFVQHQVAWDLQSLLQSSPPAEVEMLMSKWLQLSAKSYVRIPDDSRMGAWQGSASRFLASCLSRAGLQGSVSELSGRLFRVTVDQRFSRSVSPAGSSETSWTLEYDPQASLPTSFPIVLRDSKGRTLPLDLYGVSLQTLNTLKISQFSRRYLFTLYCSLDVSSRFMFPGGTNTLGAPSRTVPLSESAARLYFGDLASGVLPYQSPVHVGNTMDKAQTDLWFVGIQLVYDPVISIYAHRIGGAAAAGGGGGGGEDSSPTQRKLLSTPGDAEDAKKKIEIAAKQKLIDMLRRANKENQNVPMEAAFQPSPPDAVAQPTEPVSSPPALPKELVMSSFTSVTSSVEDMWNILKDILPDSSVQSDFSLLFHQSGQGDLSLKIAKEYPSSVVVSYTSSGDDAHVHASSAVSMGVKNSIVGNARQFHETDAHDPVERVIYDVKSSLDLFDFQVLPAEVFTSFLHHTQPQFEALLGHSFSLARSTVFTIPFIHFLEEGYAMFGGKKLETGCYDKRNVALDTPGTVEENKIMQRVLGLVLCSADAANVEVKARLLKPVKVTGWPSQKTAVVEVTLVSMQRPVGGMFRLLDEDGHGPRDRVGESLEGSVALDNYHLNYKRGSSGEESLHLVRKDGKKNLLWKSPPRGRGQGMAGPLEKGRGVSVYSLLAVRPIPSWRRDLAQMYLRDADTIINPLRNLAGKAEPWNTFLYHGTLFFVYPFARDADGNLLHDGGLDDAKADVYVEKSEAQLQLEVDMAAGMGLAADMAELQKRWFDSPLSFVEHESDNGFTAASIARIFSKSSVIIVTNNNDKRREIERLLRRNAASNAIVVLQERIEKYANDMAFSPEHFNFQYFNGFYAAWRRDENNFDGMFSPKSMGAILSCAEVSYFLLPHPKIMSLALAVFHGPDPTLHVYGAPSEAARNKHVDHFAQAVEGSNKVDASILELYELSAHPEKTPLKDWDFDLIESRFENPDLESLSMQRVPVPRARVGVTMKDIKNSPSGRWTLVRVMPTRMRRIVQHHFRAELDGHKRRYLLRHVYGEEAMTEVKEEIQEIEKDWSTPVAGVGRTWLQRMGDGGQPVSNSLIPYTHFGISLITLLRIGVSDYAREKLYGQFLQIPVYEDMATWNIQWNNGRLGYVDVDTMQSHLEIVLPHAYQMILALMNYERTVADFGKCEGAVHLMFGIPFVGNCVKPRNDQRSDERLRRDLGCTDKLPVPCADGTCKPTFVHCLRDLYEKQVTGETIASVKEEKAAEPDKFFELSKKKPKKKKHALNIERLPDAQ